jgi:predicted choloylglycine hydrolase
MGTSDGLWGLVDGINDAGLALSLTFGGRRVVGDGFGVPLILRYVLQTCNTAAEAAEALARIPCHMSYNVTALDRKRQFVTAYMAPDRPAVITHAAVATNHQERVEWSSHARFTATVERERYLLQRLTLHREPKEKFISAFLKPPLYSTAFSQGFGTLYTAVYQPRSRSMSLRWPGTIWAQQLGDFVEDSRQVRYPLAA